MSPAPEPQPKQSYTHPDQRVPPDSKDYKFDAEFSRGCDALFWELKVPASPTSGTQRAEYRQKIEALLARHAHSHPGLHNGTLVLLSSGLPTSVIDVEFKKKPGNTREIIVPFLCAHCTGETRLHVVLGVFVTSLNSCALDPIGTIHSEIKNPATTDKLIPALQWMELVERIQNISGFYVSQLKRYIYEDTDTASTRPALHKVTSREVLEEARTRALQHFDEAYARCQELGLEVSHFDLYKGIKAGALPLSDPFRSLYHFFEDARLDTRVPDSSTQSIAALLSKRSWFFWYKNSMDEVQRKNPHALNVIDDTLRGLAALRTTDDQGTSPLSRLKSQVNETLSALCRLGAQVSDDGAVIVGTHSSPLNEVARLMNESYLQLDALENNPARKSKHESRISFIDTIIAVPRAERAFTQAMLALKTHIQIEQADPDAGSGSTDMWHTFEESLEVLRLFRRTFDECFPGLLQFLDRPPA